jgi:secretion/DNA translocation related TadE-like protein
MLLVLSSFAAFLTMLAAVSAQRARASAAADLAALTGADVLAHFGSAQAACAATSRLAALNRASVESCAVNGDEVRVTVATTGPAMFGMQATATARAGMAGPTR